LLAGLLPLIAPRISAESSVALLDLARNAHLEPYPLSLRAPSFRLPGLNGDSFSDSDFQGPFVLLTFWASWCWICRAEFSSLERLQASFDGDEFQVVGAAVSDTLNSIERFLGMRAPPFPILLDSDRKTAEKYRAAGVPVSYLLDCDGRIVAGKSGEHHWDEPATVAVVRYLVSKGKT
jgi:peroxiredoxin